MALKIFKEFECQWKISVEDKPTEFKNIVTPYFSPLPDISITFCFEAWYQLVEHTKKNVYLFKLKLVKLSSMCISPTLEVNVQVKVNYSDGSVFVEYTKLYRLNLVMMNDIAFGDKTEELFKSHGYYSSHYYKMCSNSLFINCQMTFSDHEQTSPIKSSIEMKLCNKHVDLIRNLKSVYESSVLSDFVFKVGDKTFPAHKFVLAAHSPVFQNMLIHEFLESKTNCVTITDSTPDTFDSFLRYLYSGELEDKSWDSLKEIYYLVDKYDVGFLKKECTDAIISLLSADLVCEILKLAYSYSDAGMKTTAITFAVEHIKEIVLREDWKELVTSHPMIGYEVTVNFIPK